MLNLKRWTAAVLCAALGLGLSACTLKTPANVMTVDGVQVPAGVYLMYQLNAYTEAERLVEDGAAVQDGQTGCMKRPWKICAAGCGSTGSLRPRA